MPTNLRKLGVHGQNNPVKSSSVVRGSDFNIGAIIGLFGRRYKVPMICNNITEFNEKFGDHEISSYYGWDAIKGFFDNIANVDGKLYVVGHVGYDGSVYDGVSANATLVDGAAADTLKLESAYEEELDYSSWGNRTGYTITNGDRFTTDIKTASAAGDSFVICTSVAGMCVGDIIKVIATGGGGATVHKEITAIDESTGKVSFTGVFDGAAFPQVDDVVSIPGFRLRVYRKSLNGVESEVEEELGKVWCTMQDSVTDYFVENVFSSSKYLKCTDQDSESAIGSTFPADVTTVTYLTGGDNGTSPSTSSHWSQDLLALDNYPVRFIANPETSTETIQKAIETYCKGRDDTPIVIFNVPEDQTKSQLQTIGANFQRSDDVMGVLVGDWVTIKDPFAVSSLAPDRNIPNVGHVMGAWIRCIATYGIHYIPSIHQLPLLGITGIVRTTKFSDDDRTDIAEYGMNIIQFVNGSGYIIRNFFTPSTTVAYQFANGLLMRNYIKVSSEDSLQTSENTPNSFNRVKSDADAIRKFMFKLWRKGSTGSVPEGETFGRIEDEEGNQTSFFYHVQVQADIVNNPQSSLNAGERNLDVYFTYPAPAGSIRIGVGILLRS